MKVLNKGKVNLNLTWPLTQQSNLNPNLGFAYL
jgi:hypothetical protein